MSKILVFKSHSPRRRFMKKEKYAPMVGELPEDVDKSYSENKQLFRELCANCGKPFGTHYGELATCALTK